MNKASRHISMNPFEETIVNVFEIESKKIVFTGSVNKAAKFLGCTESNISHGIQGKRKMCKKKYAVRYVHEKVNNE